MGCWRSTTISRVSQLYPLDEAAKKPDSKVGGFHRHLDLYPDHERPILECDQAEVATLSVTHDTRSMAAQRELAASSRYIRVALGLHPQLVAERESELPLLERLLERVDTLERWGWMPGPVLSKL